MEKVKYDNSFRDPGLGTERNQKRKKSNKLIFSGHQRYKSPLPNQGAAVRNIQFPGNYVPVGSKSEKRVHGQ